jgi:phage terminase small subunit
MSQNATATDKLTRRQKQGVQALLTARTVVEAAAAIGARRRTLQRWLKQPAFKQALQEAQAELLTQASRQMQAELSEAVATLVSLMDESNVASVRLRASEALLTRALLYVDAVELQQRITVLEERLANVSTDSY